jgi:hypothetical protein
MMRKARGRQASRILTRMSHTLLRGCYKLMINMMTKMRMKKSLKMIPQLRT